MHQPFPLDALLLDRTSETPLAQQLYRALRSLIHDRTLRAGSGLPSTRSLAQDLGVARNTVFAAYEQLITEGYITNRRGARSTVVDLPAGLPGADARPRPPMPRSLSKRGEVMTRQPNHMGRPGEVAFHPGMPDAGSFPFGLWSRLLARRSNGARSGLFGSYNITGFPLLREAISSYLRAARGVRCSPEQIVVTTGAQAALDLLARLLLDPGETVWMEEPGYLSAQAAFTAAGADLSPLHVSSNGWALEPPRGAAIRLIYITPSCHHPLGATMRMEQRLRLLEIAEKQNAWIVEDDFDSEYRFQGHPVPALQGLDGAERVIYIGSFSKLLFPALRIGFMVLPPALRDGIDRVLSISGQFAPLVLQAALADFIMQGQMSRHLRRMRRIYASRRVLFRQLCTQYLGDSLTLADGESGIQMVGLFGTACDDREVAQAAGRRGVNVSPLSIHYRHGTPRHGLIMGYAAADEALMHRGMCLLRDAVAECQTGSAHR